MVDPYSRFVYHDCGDCNEGGVCQHRIGADGTLTPLDPLVVGQPGFIAVHPSGEFAYVTNSSSNTVWHYGVGVDGQLSLLAPATVVTGTGPRSIAVDPSGQFAYVANGSSNDVSQYRIAADGQLNALAPTTVAAGESPRSIALSQ